MAALNETVTRHSNVESDDLRWWDLKIMVDAGLQILVQKRLELLVLLIE